MAIRQITVVGTGLIGGSFALALKQRACPVQLVGCDREAVLVRARQMGAIDRGVADPVQACQGSDVVLLAAPVGAIIDLLERLCPLLPPATLVSDVGSTKAAIVARARAVFGDQVGRRFLPGHPMAGKENGGIEHADAGLFEGAVWLVTPLSEDPQEARATEFLGLVKKVGARVVAMDPDRHDRLCAWISHLPQMLSTTLAAVLEEEFGDDPLLVEIGGRALREMTRIASSPYLMWRDIALTNTQNIQEALMRLEQHLAHVRENLRTRELESEFQRARQFRKP